ncbi:hypothetical protein [Thioclava sp. ES.031]|uniref:hypothetical protein n=2 Tax=unclassified Thioclava TaxID=2621713 RepID=UPI000BF65F7C|nr:hypothetical protein [Thioclava sp. ES.031]MPQ95827.1 hypothetical protein [Thioclava sp. JE_KL1]
METQAAVGEVTAALTDGRADISEGVIVMKYMPLCLAELGESDEDRMIRGVLDLLVRAGEVGVGGLQQSCDEEVNGPGMG